MELQDTLWCAGTIITHQEVLQTYWRSKKVCSETFWTVFLAESLGNFLAPLSNVAPWGGTGFRSAVLTILTRRIELLLASFVFCDLTLHATGIIAFIYVNCGDCCCWTLYRPVSKTQLHWVPGCKQVGPWENIFFPQEEFLHGHFADRSFNRSYRSFNRSSMSTMLTIQIQVWILCHANCSITIDCFLS